MAFTRRDFIKSGATASLGTFLATGGRSQAAPVAPPNLVVIMADDLSAKEFGCYGHPEFKTPHIDRMAREGVMFETCWCTPICSPTRAQMMTGKYGFRTRWFHNDLKDGSTPLSKNHIIFSQMLKQQKYATAICGKWQLPGSSAEHGFDEFCMWESNGKKPMAGFDGPIEKWDPADGRPPGGFLNNRAARYWHPQISLNGTFRKTGPNDYGPDIFTDFLIDFAKRKKDAPFFIYLPMALTHKSWDFDREVAGWLPTPRLDAQGNRVDGQSEPGLRSNVEYMDYLIGRIERELTHAGLMDNTVLFITGDNGTSGYGKGQVELEKGPRVPLIVYGPGHVKRTGVSKALTNHCDIFATLRDLSGATLPTDYVIDGHSFAPLLAGAPFKAREWVFSYYKFQRMLRDTRWLLDGRGHFYDCGDRRDETEYKDVTQSDDPEVLAARKRFETILKELPGPDPEDPIVQAYKARAGKGARGVKFIVPETTDLTLEGAPLPIVCKSFGTLAPIATATWTRKDEALEAKIDVTVEGAMRVPIGKPVWGKTDGVEVSLYAPVVGSLIVYVYPDGTTEFFTNTKGEKIPRKLKPGYVTAEAVHTARGWTTTIALNASLFGSKLPKSLKFNVGGYRTGKKPGWFAWINQGRENFRPKNQGKLALP